MCVYIISNCSLFSRIELLSSTSIAINHSSSNRSGHYRHHFPESSLTTTTTDNINPKHLFLRVAKRVAVAGCSLDWLGFSCCLAGYTVFLLLKLTYFRQFFLLSISHTHKYTRKYTHGVEEIPVDPSSYLILNLVKLHRKSLIFDIFALENAFFRKFSLFYHTLNLHIYQLSEYIYIYIRKRVVKS